MIFSKITQNGLTLTTDTTTIPAQYSNNIQFQFIQDTENYSGYTPSVCVALYDSSLIECADILNPGGNVAIEDGIFSVGNQILYRSGYLAIGITLTNGDENISLQPVIYKVFPSVGGLSPLPPDTGEWQQVVTAYVETYINPISQQLQEVVTEVSNQQTEIDNAISVMGDYQIVSNDPVQIQFKKGDGTYGDTVDLGDGLASKSMVNGKYYQSAAEMYSGAASNYGIQVQQIMGAYVQDGTPTPDNPVDPQFNVINDFYTSGENLFNINGNVNTQGNNGSQVSLNTVENGILTSNVKGEKNHGVGQKISGLKGKTVSFSAKAIGLGTTNKAWIFIYDGGGVAKARISFNNINEVKGINNYTCNSDNIVFCFSCDGLGAGAKFTDIMVNFGDTAQPYTQFVGLSTTPVSLELRALPDGTADVWEDGKITRNIAKVTFDGSSDEVWTYESSGYKRVRITISDAYKVYGQRVMCLCTVGTSNDSLNANYPYLCFIGQDGGFYFYLDETMSSVEEWKTYLQSNPINVYYPLATPTTEPLAIPTLTSYYPFTNAWCDSAIETMITWNVLTGNVKNDQLDPAIQQYIDSNVPALITEAVNAALASYCPFIVGDIYITMNEENPNTRYPGTKWQAIEGETLVGYLEGDENFGTLGASVGEAEHTLTVDEMPSHSHEPSNGSDNNFVVSGTGAQAGIQQGGESYVTVATTSNTGGGQPHNNIQPSKVVMIWQRTA